jgi:uncharacterized circularly permuted ATP-grasp superfamily protein/uncharacterized alpha-E superfamily protein
VKEQLAAAFDEIGLDELYRRRSEAARLLNQDGVVYNAYNESPTPGRAWRLDPLPTVLSSHEWQQIESGVLERAELLSLILEDIYGPRELLRRRLLPAELVYGHSGFLRAADGIRIPGAHQLFLYAVDLGRDETGELVALADRSQAPSGAAYALENRTVISRVLPSLYRDAQVHRLAPFFRSLRTSLQEVAPPSAEYPRIVVLTPGSLNETAFEHATLAATLGYPLVQGSDLTVRGDRVYMRSVGQFEPVDVILRRVDDWYSDPLELRTDSQLGVPGLLEMARAGSVAVVNTLGSGVLENPALMAFLPQLGKHLLGSEPRLASVPTWWCGDPDSRRYVLEHLDELVVRPISHGPGRSTRLGWELSGAELDELRARILQDPGRWAAQSEVPLSSVPVLTDDGLESRRSVMRAFAVARKDSFVVMPGGLTRVQPSGEAHRMSGQAGSVAKDTWVLASEPEALGAFWLQSGPAIEGIDPMASIPSRAAENLWWLGRYAERAEALTRLMRTVVDRTNEFGSGTNPAGSTALNELMGALHWISGGQTTLADSVRALLDNAYAVRDQLSRDTWLVIGPLERIMRDLRVPLDEPQLQSQAALQQVIQSLLALSGLGVESMVRDLGWRFLDAGRRLERSIQLLSLLQSTVVKTRDQATDSIVLESVLSAAESIITYRFRYRSQAQLETLLELLLLDTGNPRSLAYQLDRLIDDLEALPLGGRARLRPEQRLALEAVTMLRLAEPEELARVDEHGGRPQLEQLLSALVERLLAAGDAVDSGHFVHTAPTVSLVGATGTSPAIVRGR